MYNFENKRCDNGNGIHYSRIIASWVVANKLRGKLFNDNFKDWLKTLELSDDEIQEIYEMATNGRMECENHARKFIASSN